MPIDIVAYGAALNKTQKAIQDALAGLAELNGIVMSSVAGRSGAPIVTAPVAAVSDDLTQFSPGPGNPKPDSDPQPDRATATLREWLAFLDDHSLAAVPGQLIGYIQYRGGYQPNVAFAMATQWSKYPPALTHCQTLRAIQQGLPMDKDIGARWNADARTWLDSTGAAYSLSGLPDPTWAAWHMAHP